MMAVEVKLAPRFETNVPRALFKKDALAFLGSGDQYDVAPDGNRFLVLEPVGPAGTGAELPFTVVLNWRAGLKK